MVIFSGGRGTGSICKALLDHPEISLSVLVNAYDDGKSTGALRRYVPGMLGPSDIRKTISNLLRITDQSAQSLRDLIEYRFPGDTSFQQGMDVVEAFANGRLPNCEDLRPKVGKLRVDQFETIVGYCRAYADYVARLPEEKRAIPFGDFSLGNLFFTGTYLSCGQDFNAAVEEFNSFCEIGPQVINITQGENFVLCGIKKDGEFLKNEAEVVSEQTSTELHEVYLLERYLHPEELEELSQLDFTERKKFVQARERFPKINPKAERAIASADLIIYGPGTQHSSLYPSYLTEGVAEAILANAKAQKIFVGNLTLDHEIQAETINSLIEKCIGYMNRKNQLASGVGNLITTCFIHDGNPNNNCIPYNLGASPLNVISTKTDNWEWQQGKHLGSRVVDELIALANARLNKKLRSLPHMVSIVVPGLNEEKTVGEVLHKLTLINMRPQQIETEILYVDGGSQDQSLALAQAVESVRVFSLPPGTGRGEAIRHGIAKSRGNIIATFPSDGEYDVDDLVKAINIAVASKHHFVYGTRLLKCLDLEGMIGSIYGRNKWLYALSKYGGKALSIATLLMYNRYISDLLVGIKVFEASVVKQFDLSSKGIDLEAEITAKVALHRRYVLEYPVRYRPRTRSQGKKITVFDGLKALWSLFRWKLASLWKASLRKDIDMELICPMAPVETKRDASTKAQRIPEQEQTVKRAA